MTNQERLPIDMAATAVLVLLRAKSILEKAQEIGVGMEQAQKDVVTARSMVSCFSPKSSKEDVDVNLRSR